MFWSKRQSWQLPTPQEYVRKVDLLILDWKSPPKQGPKEVTVSIGRGEPTKVALWGSREQLLTKFPASIWDAPWWRRFFFFSPLNSPCFFGGFVWGSGLCYVICYSFMWSLWILWEKTASWCWRCKAVFDILQTGISFFYGGLFSGAKMVTFSGFW